MNILKSFLVSGIYTLILGFSSSLFAIDEADVGGLDAQHHGGSHDEATNPHASGEYLPPFSNKGYGLRGQVEPTLV